MPFISDSTGCSRLEIRSVKSSKSTLVLSLDTSPQVGNLGCIIACMRNKRLRLVSEPKKDQAEQGGGGGEGGN